MSAKLGYDPAAAMPHLLHLGGLDSVPGQVLENAFGLSRPSAEDIDQDFCEVGL